MIFLEHSRFSDASIAGNLGAPQYSYHFVRKAFEPALDRLGRRVAVGDPHDEVSALFEDARTRGEECFFLAFNPPHKIEVNATCPTIPIFAWEYDTIPDEVWEGEQRHDWRAVLAQAGQAITLSQDSAASVRSAMGEDFPVWAIPAPLFDRFAKTATPAHGVLSPRVLKLDGALAIDVRAADLSIFRPERSFARAGRALRVLERAMSQSKRLPPISLSGVIYATVFSPADDRKNWRDLVAGFIWAFRDVPDAALIVKLTHSDLESGMAKILRFVSTLGGFRCQLIVVQGMLDSDAYASLIDVASYYVNTATAEGQCLPLTEYMSSNRPALAPAHTSMLDYVNPKCAFVIESDARPAFWPHDERGAVRARHYLISFADLVRKYRQSYAVAKERPEQYQRMATAAAETMRDYCSEEIVADRLRDALSQISARCRERCGLDAHAIS